MKELQNRLLGDIEKMKKDMSKLAKQKKSDVAVNQASAPATEIPDDFKEQVEDMKEL